ncbi:FAD-dependent oxidoreductase [Halalkalibacter oceani]|uniref:FAD-dependent monooxygenase n=1 Tax=Halalkalibacter oceani TaxID=1653776 RepID=A0A9X2IQD5_9BACI|nr:NAD(P)/FAD-dependent oxidoreductase [Halalkalibacter oceani]MCM3715372.1 FAD-dependent monooxygenase [Halalkalibacter oceani]
MNTIAIVGGGPIGLALGVGLVRKGLKVELLEKRSSISTFPKASTIHPPTLEILDEWGLFEKAKKIGRVVDRIQYWNRKTEELIVELQLNLLRDYTKFPYRLHFDQQFLSQIFLEALQKSPLATVKFETEVVDVHHDSHSVTLTTKETDGKITQQSFDYLVAADGISSSVREKLGISFTGHTNPAYHLLMGLKEYEISNRFPNLAGVAMFLDNDEWVDMITNPDMLKVIIPISHDRTEEITNEFIRNKMTEIGIVKDGFDIYYKTIYKTHQLVADRMNDGRVVLIGDAAHVNIEFGGMGMNSGIHDAYLLVDKFERIKQGGDAEQHFKQFAERRMKINKEVVQRDTIKNTQLIKDIDTHEKQLRQLADNEALAKKHLLRTSMIEGFNMMFEDMNFNR